MKPDHSIARLAPPPLGYRIDDDSSPAEIAAACAALWQELQGVLCPIIGVRGVQALGQRSLQLASAVHPWLVAGQPGGPHSLDTSMLVPLLAQRSRDDAAAAGSTFLDTFRELLSRLIGASLTERLLLTVWGPSDTSINSTTAQDPTP